MAKKTQNPFAPTTDELRERIAATGYLSKQKEESVPAVPDNSHKKFVCGCASIAGEGWTGREFLYCKKQRG